MEVREYAMALCGRSVFQAEDTLCAKVYNFRAPLGLSYLARSASFPQVHC